MTARRYMSGLPQDGGERGGLPSGSSVNEERGKDPSLSLPEGRADAGTLADVLVTAGILLLAPERRMAVAETLAAGGVTLEDVQLLRAYIEENERDQATARRYLAAIVSDLKRCKDALAGLREYRRRQEAAQINRTADHTFGFPSPYWSCACEGCVALRARGDKDHGAPSWL